MWRIIRAKKFLRLQSLFLGMKRMLVLEVKECHTVCILSEILELIFCYVSGGQPYECGRADTISNNYFGKGFETFYCTYFKNTKMIKKIYPGIFVDLRKANNSIPPKGASKKCPLRLKQFLNGCNKFMFLFNHYVHYSDVQRSFSFSPNSAYFGGFLDLLNKQEFQWRPILMRLTLFSHLFFVVQTELLKSNKTLLIAFLVTYGEVRN